MTRRDEPGGESFGAMSGPDQVGSLHMFWHQSGASGWIMMAVGIFVFWALAALLLLAAFHHLHRAQQSRRYVFVPVPSVLRTTPTEQQILAERFSRGDIDEDDYRSQLHVIHETKS
jgi:putative membrane protein